MPDAAPEPVAVVGLGCRFPGARGPQAFWRLLCDGVDAVDEVPADRWDAQAYYDPDPAAPGRMVTLWGGFLTDVDKFDAEFFGVSPHEAARMDPQQRLMLEVAWEALENAAIVPDSLKRSDTGVFVGIGNTDYTRMLCRDMNAIDRYDGTGGTLSFAANRLSYFLDLHGPSLGMESACSSSLVALHSALKALRDGEAGLALVGGVNLVLTPDMTIAFSHGHMMSPTGRCRTFDAAADGYVRGEGCGVLVLKPLSRALADGNRLWAVILGSAINQDGGSNGITAPNGAAQQAVIARACTQAGIAPGAISYVEAHGTGTRLGDPIEIRAIKAALGEGRPAGLKCRIGSVKTNIGHLEAAAGIAGLIKTVLMLAHRKIVPHLHLHELNPLLGLDDTPFEIATASTDWEVDGGPRLAGVSSFSFGGTNCHVVLGEAPPQPEATSTLAPCLVPLSARHQDGLTASAAAYGADDTLAAMSIGDIAFTAAKGRTHFPHRLAVVAGSTQDLQDKLSAWRDGKAGRGVSSGLALRNRRPDVVFMFTGQGAHYAGMGRQLAARFPLFRQTLDACETRLRRMQSRCSLTAILDGSAPESAYRDPAVVQPALFAFEIALARLWQSLGIVPSAVIGHSLGEYAAACMAGVFDVEAGLELVAARGRLTGALAAPGAMLSVFAAQEELAERVAADAARVSIAVINGPRHTVLSGDPETIQRLETDLAARGIDCRPLDISHGFHSPLMDAMHGPFAEAADQYDYRAPSLPLMAGLTGRPWPEGAAPDADYWRRHLREPVQFWPGLKALADGAPRVFLEIGPGSSLARVGARCGLGDEQVWLSSIEAERDEAETLLAALGALYTRGAEVNWDALGDGGRIVTLPSYPFQRHRHWYSDVAPPLPVSPETAPVMTPAQADAPPDGRGREETILSAVIARLAKLLHSDAATIDPQASFLELGADSLVLVDAVQQFARDFAVRLSVKQLFEDLPTPQALAAHIAAAGGAAPLDAPAAAIVEDAPIVPVATDSAGAAESDVAALIRQQLQVMAQQLELLKDGDKQRARPAPPPVPSAPSPASSLSPSSSPPPPVSRLSATQQGYLDALTHRFVARTARSRDLARNSRAALADSRASAGFRPSIKEMLYPIIGASGAGAHLRDIDGNDYVDIAMGFGVLLFGHNPDFVADALRGQFTEGLQIGPQSPLASEVATLVCEFAGAERMCFCNSGTEAVMTALRLARAATGRTKVAVFSGAYHGHGDGVLAAATGEPSSLGVTRGAVEDIVVLDYGAPEALERLEREGESFAAVLVEPVQSRNPALQPRDFLHRLRAVTERMGTVLIFDEVLTGFRVAQGGAQEWFGVKADLVTYGKIVGGGLPIGMAAGKARLLDGIDGGAWDYGDASHPRAETVFFAGTFNKNHLGMAAARAVLRHLKAQGPALQQALNARTSAMAGTLNDHFERQGMPLRVAQFGSLFRFSTQDNIDPFFYGLNEKGVYVWEGRTCFLSTAHSDDDVARIVEAACATADEMQQAGWFASTPRRASAAKTAEAELVELRGTHDLAGYSAGIAALDELAGGFVRNAFCALGARLVPGETVTTAALARELGIAAQHDRLFERLLNILAGDGYLASNCLQQWTVVRAVAADDLETETRAVVTRFPAVAHEAAMMARCGAALADVLRGRRHPLELLFPNGDLAAALALYAQSPMAIAMNTLLQRALGDAVARLHDAARAEGRALKIVELGAGTGGSTSYLVDALPREGVEYHFTDLSPRFLISARDRFAHHAFMQYRVLDVEQPPQDGGAADIVIAANVLHATEDLRRTLGNVRGMMRPGGTLLLLEGTGRARWLDLVFGLTDGWWRFADKGLRADHALLDAERWTALLTECGFADAAALRSGATPAPGEQTVLTATRPAPLALSDSQRALWAISQLGAEASAAYHESITIALHGPLDRAALDRAIADVAARHDALRMRFDGAANAQMCDAQIADPVCVDVAGEEGARAWIATAVAAPFDFATGPLARFALLRLAPEHHWLLLIAHHAISDGVSLVLLARELGALYSAHVKGEALALDAAPQFGDYLRRRTAEDAIQAENLDYWRGVLTPPLPRMDLPLDKPRPAVQSHAGARLQYELPAELTDRVMAMAARQACTPFMLLLAGLRVLLRALTGEQDAVIGISAAGQNAQGAADLVGYCVDVLPLRLRADADLTFGALLRDVREHVLDALSHHAFSFPALIAALDLRRDPSRAALIDVHFNYDKLESGFSFAGLKAEVFANFSGFVRRDLTVNPVEREGRLALVFDYASDLFAPATIEGWLNDYAWILDMITRHEDMTLGALIQALSSAKAGTLKLVSGDRLKVARRKPTEAT